MQPKLHLSSSLSAVRIVEHAPAGENVPVSGLATPAAPSASVRIRQARQLLEDLVLEDDLDGDNGLLLTAVAFELNRILLELEQFAGLQRMFELWVQDAP